MHAHRCRCLPMQCRQQRGAAALITVLFLLIVVAFAVLVSLTMSGSDVSDSASQHNSVQALFLAESAIERASGRAAAGIACASLAPDTTAFAAGSSTVVAATVVGANCKLRVTGTVAGNTRTVDAVLTPAGGAITADPSVMTPYANFSASPSIPSYTVPAGASILLVGISISNANSTASVTYGGTAMSPGPSIAGASPWPRARIFYLVSPPAGSASIVATLNPGSEVVMGARWFSGVNTSTGVNAPWDVAAATATGNGNPKRATVPITPVTSGAWIFETTAIDKDDVTCLGATAACTALTNQLFRWEASANGNVRGAASTVGPVSPAATQSSAWSWTTGNVNKWSQAAVALRPGGSPSLLSWSEVVQ